MFLSVGTEIFPSDYSDDIEFQIPLLSDEGTYTWFRPPPESSSSASTSQKSSSRSTSVASVASVANYKSIPTPEAISVISQDNETAWEKKHETLLMSLWSLVYCSTLLTGIFFLIWGCLGGRIWPKVIGGVFVGLHVLVCVGMVVVETYFDGMGGTEEQAECEEEV